VTRKLFTLIFGNPNKIVSNEKILPKESIGDLLDSQQVLQSVKNDAEQYKTDIAKTCEGLKDKAKIEGYQEGYQQWLNSIAQLENEITKVRGDIEKMIIPIALKAAKKIVGREIELKEDTVVDIVLTSLKSVAQHKKVTIYVNKKDLDTIEKNRNRIKDIFEAIESLSIREKPDVERGGCVIETEGGIINARLENQWSALERAFTSLINPKKKEETIQPGKKN